MGDRLRVLYLAPSGDLNGGAQIQYRYLIDGLARSHYQPVVVTPALGAMSAAMDRSSVQTFVSEYPTWSRSDILRWRHRLWPARRRARHRLIALARTCGPRLVHGDFVVAPYVTAIADSLGIPSIVHVRGPVTRRQIRTLGLGRTSALIAIGTSYRDALVEQHLPAERIAVIEDATDLSYFVPRHSEPQRSDPRSSAAREVVFGIVGRIEPFKRQLDFLRAAGRIVRRGRRARFLVIGAPNPNRPLYARRVQAFARACGIHHAVTFTGWMSDIAEAISALDVLVTLSGGSVMLEALACGVPVITATTRNPASLRIVRDGECGRVVPAHDLDALMRVMLELCDDAGQRRCLGANGRRRAEALFGCGRLIDETVRIYDEVLARSGPRTERNAPCALA
jgi:glycosyltransferase involved in cell wall biosynthesis